MLRPAVGIGAEYAAGLQRLVRELYAEVEAEMRRVFEEHVHHAANDSAMDAPDDQPWGNVSSQARIALNRLLEKYQPKFDKWARDGTGRMIDRTVKHSNATLRISLREMSETMTTLPLTAMSDRLREVITASSNQAAGLIKLIPARYLQEVGGQVARSITSGQGLADLVPYLTKKYHGDIRWARLVALDQTRKVYSAVNAAKMEQIGVKQYRWIHTPGSWHPRKLHERMSGNVYSLDDPPVIDERTGERGIPGQAIFCRCTMQPIVKFGES